MARARRILPRKDSDLPCYRPQHRILAPSPTAISVMEVFSTRYRAVRARSAHGRRVPICAGPKTRSQGRPRTRGQPHSRCRRRSSGRLALQLQNDLEKAGHRVVGPARSLKHGLKLASQEVIDAALLDVSLGRETSAPIADALLACNIPLAFATGYSDSVMLPDHLREIPKLSKPYVVGEISKILDALVGPDERLKNAPSQGVRD